MASDSLAARIARLLLRIALPLVALAALLSLFPVWYLVSGSRHSAPCTFPGIPQVVASPPAEPASFKPVKLVLISGQATTLAFNRDLGPKTLTLQYGINGTIPFAGGNQSPQLGANDLLGFVRDDQEALPGSQVDVKSWVQNGRVLLKVCIDRTGAGFAAPGSYQGTISIVDPRVSPVSIPVTVTLDWPIWQWVMELLVAAAVAGTWYVWVLQAPKNSAGAPVSLLDFCSNKLGILSIGAGIVAAFGVYSATYLNSVTWGSSSGQVFALFGAMFSAFLAGATAVHVSSKAGQTQAFK
jgi:hypothetical protein